MSHGRGAPQRRRVVAARFRQINGRVNGAGGSWPDELLPPRVASGSLYEERRMDDPRKISLLRNRDAATQRSDSADRHDRGRPPNQIGRQSVAPGDRETRQIATEQELGALRAQAEARSFDREAAERVRRAQRDEGDARQLAELHNE